MHDGADGSLIVDIQNGDRLDSFILWSRTTYRFALLCFLAVNVKLTTATIRWYSTSQPTFTRYNVSLKSGNKCNETRRQCNKSSVTFSNLTMAKLYTVKVTGIAKNGDFAIATVMFYLPGNSDKYVEPIMWTAKNTKQIEICLKQNQDYSYWDFRHFQTD